jgi:hypothetical protein
MESLWRWVSWEQYFEYLSKAKDLRCNLGLIRSDGNSAANGLAKSQILQSGRGYGSGYEFEALDSRNVSGGDAGELVGLGCVNRRSNGLSSENSLEHIGSKSSAFVINDGTSEWERFATYPGC